MTLLIDDRVQAALFKRQSVDPGFPESGTDLFFMVCPGNLGQALLRRLPNNCATPAPVLLSNREAWNHSLWPFCLAPGTRELLASGFHAVSKRSFADMAYETIDGQQYEKELLELARKHTTGKGEGQLSKDEVAELFKSAEDGRGVTDTERATLAYIRKSFEFTEAAAADFDAAFARI